MPALLPPALEVPPQLAARACAVDILHRILKHKQGLDNAMQLHTRFRKLEPRDRAFCRLLVATSLRRLALIRYLLALYLQKPLKGKYMPVECVLLIGGVQLLWLDTPPHAAVHSMVSLTKLLGFTSHSGMVNAVLKKLGSEGPEQVQQMEKDVRQHLPPWMWQSWERAYGIEETQRIVAVQMGEPPLDLTLSSSVTDETIESLGGERLMAHSLRLPKSTNPEELAGFAHGHWWVQDIAASLPVSLLGELKDKHVLELCAAPGGKTAQLINAGAKVTALDRSRPRLDLLKKNMRRLNMQAETVVADVLQWKAPQLYDVVILDAPCSATGTLRRHPDIAWSKRPADVDQLKEIQSKMLAHAAKMVTPGGILLYCVCSLQQDEGEMQVQRFLTKQSTWRTKRFTVPEGLPAECITPEGWLRTLPCHFEQSGGMDGFFAAALTC